MNETTSTENQPFTTTLEQMALCQQILDPDASYAEYLEGLQEAARDLEIELADEYEEMDEPTADRLLAYFREHFMGDQD